MGRKPNRAAKTNLTKPSSASTASASDSTTTTSASTTATSTANTAAEVQIQRAQAAVGASRLAAATLHSQWKLYLVRLSYMVILITIHQLQAPMISCIYDVKSYNNSLTPLDDESMRISGFRAFLYALSNSACEVLAVIMGICLTAFLTQVYTASATILLNPSGTTSVESYYTNKTYMLATGLVPAVLNFYFHRSKQNLSCLDQSDRLALSDRLWTRYAEQDNNMTSPVGSFPVVIIFHTIATGCCWFMDMQQSYQNRNLQMLLNLKKELYTARDEYASKKNS